MTITLGSVTISDNMYLGGVTEAAQTAAQQVRTVEGNSILTTVSTPGGRTITLETQQVNGGIQGIWCQSVIDAVKALESNNTAVVLAHHGTTYNVKITDTTDLSPLFSWEPVGVNKKYTGKITTIEV